MKTAFFPYSIDDEGRLNLIWVRNNVTNNLLIEETTNIKDDVIDEVLKELELEVDSDRVLYLGTFTLDSNFNGGSSDNISNEKTKDIDTIAINVTGMNLKQFSEKYGLKELPAFTLNYEENSLLLATVFKLILVQKSLSEKEDEIDYQDDDIDSEIENTQEIVSPDSLDDLDTEIENPNIKSPK
jgi:hypothetical protein